MEVFQQNELIWIIVGLTSLVLAGLIYALRQYQGSIRELKTRLESINEETTIESRSREWRAHYRFAVQQIKLFMDNPESTAPLTPVIVPPGSPI